MKAKLPTIRELSALVRHVAKQVPRANDPDAADYIDWWSGDPLPSIYLTIGFNPEDGSWGYQTGDNSYTGGAYGSPVWAVTSVYRRNDSPQRFAGSGARFDRSTVGRGRVMNRDTIEVMGLKFAVTFDYDQDAGNPWDNCDGHGPVRIGRNHADGQSDKRPGERPMNSPGWHENQYYYDWAEACRMARKDGWNTEPFDAPDRVARAVQADFDYLSGWVNDEWHYVVVGVCQVDDDDNEIGAWDYCGEVETCRDYHHEMAREMAEEMARRIIRESKEREYWESRDVETV